MKNRKNNNLDNNLEKELIALQTMVRMRLLTMEDLKRIIKDIGKKYNLQVILRNHNITTDTTTIEYV